MALKPCRECGEGVSTEAAACPKCGTPKPTTDPTKDSQQFAAVLGGCVGLPVLAFFIFTAMCFGGGGGSGSSEPSPSYVDLDGAVRFTGTQFVLTNNDSFAWTNCTLDVNGGAIRSGYTLAAARIEAGETYTVGAMRFAKSDGERFNPVTMRPNRFGVECQTPRGVGFYTGEW